MATWQKTRAPPKTKAELQEMLKQAVQNTQAELKPKRPSKASKDHAYGTARASILVGQR